jgi:hypothetical protein
MPKTDPRNLMQEMRDPFDLARELKQVWEWCRISLDQHTPLMDQINFLRFFSFGISSSYCLIKFCFLAAPAHVCWWACSMQSVTVGECGFTPGVLERLVCFVRQSTRRPRRMAMLQRVGRRHREFVTKESLYSSWHIW